MRKFLGFALLLLPSLLEAQGFIRYYPPAGGAASFPLQGGTGCATPAYSFTADTNAGLCLAAVDSVRMQAAASGATGIVNATSTQGAVGFNDASGFFTGWTFGDDTATFWGSSVEKFQLGASPGTGFLALRGGLTEAVGRTITPSTGGVVTNGDGQSSNPAVGPDLATTPQFTVWTGSPPATCTAGRDFGANTSTNRACHCTSTNVWTCSGQVRTHATDCTALTDGLANDICLELDSERLFTCQPTAGGCDTAGEWILSGDGGGAFDGNVTGQFSLQADISPASFGVNQNDYAGCTLATNAVCRLTASAAVNITGLTGGADGRIVVLTNIGSNNITLTDEDAASLAANRFSLWLTGPHILTPAVSVTLFYDSTASKWKVAGIGSGSLQFGTTVTDNSLIDCADAFCIHGSTGTVASIVENSTAHALSRYKDGAGDFVDVGRFSGSSGGSQWGYANAGFGFLSSSAASSGWLIGSDGADPVIHLANQETRDYLEDSPKTLTEATATSFVQIALASGERTGGRVSYTVEASDATDHQALVGDLRWAVVNKAGVETCPTPTDIGTALTAASLGTLTCTWACDTTPANAMNLQANCTSSLTQTTLRINYRVFMDGAAGVVTPQ